MNRSPWTAENPNGGAFNALTALVETGAISEFEASDRRDDCKSKHR
jgi:hypothetical protein